VAKSEAAVNLEYFALRLFCAFVGAVPHRAAMAAARFFGWAAFRVFRLHRRRTLGRIRAAFPGIGGAEAEAIAEKSITNILMTGVEMIRAPRFDRRWMDRHIVEGQLYKDRLQALVDEGKGVVIMVPHSGNWYMAAWSMAKYGLKLFALAARQRNPKLDGWMKRQYGDIEVLDRSDRSTLVKIKDRLQRGRAFAILPDLRVRKRDVEVDFLGGKANVSRAGAMFAVKCGSPIVVAAMERRGLKHVFNHIATLRPDPAAEDGKAEAERLTREAMRLLDAEVRRNPGDWFWYNKRWILEPVKERNM
jgi:KDO2-lipid IV(A) lauroyltransferase